MSKSLSNASELEQEIFNCSPLPNVVSFDVFDTLVQRTLPHPDLTKTAAAKQLRKILGVAVDNIPLKDVVRRRLQIESEHRSQAQQSGYDPECRIDEVFAAWLLAHGLEATDGYVADLLRAEMSLELSVVHPTKGMAHLLEKLQGADIRLVFISDTYLRVEMVWNILEACGLSQFFDAGFVSCEERIAKYSGRLFESLVQEMGVDQSEVLHVGDRLDSDIHGARKASIAAKQFIDPRKFAMHSFSGAINRVRKRERFWDGALWSNRSIAKREWRDLFELDERYALGYEYLGPLFVNYVHRLARDLDRTNVELVIFNSRDGFLFRELFERLRALENVGELPRSKYAYLTRKSVYTSSLQKFGEREIDMGFHTVNPSIRNMFIRFSLPEEALIEALHRAGFDSPDEKVPDPQSSEKLKKLIRDSEFLSVMRQVQSEASKRLEKYLSDLGYWGCAAVALVDVGWNGTVQEALDIAFGERTGAPAIHGYYLALLGNKVMRSSDHSVFNGVFYDYRQSQAGTFFARFVEIFETATRAPHPTVVGLRSDGEGNVIPEFRDDDSEERRAELQDENLVASLQAGVLDYCDDYIRTYPAQDAPPESLSPFILYKLDRLIRFPTVSEARLLSSFAHSEGFGQSLVYQGNQSDDDDSTKTRQASPIRERILWREGELRQRGVPGLNVLLNGYRVIRRRRF